MDHPPLTQPDTTQLDTTSLDITDSDVGATPSGDTGNIEVRTEKLDGRRRQITATVQIPHSVERIWGILTDYETLADFIPSLKQSRRLEHPEGGIRVEQIGSESLLKVKFSARVVLDMIESFPHCLSFEMVEGDFKMFCGEWQLQPVDGDTATDLTYTLQVWPSRLMPVGMIEKRLSKGLQVNLSAIKQRADELFS
ncbi:MAG: SRPBCC family protein [Leptolyngbyaceae cyanobacterium]